jgi:hypothetical protein
MFTSHQLPTGLLFSHGANAQAPWLSTQTNKIHALIILSFSWRSRRPFVDSRIGYQWDSCWRSDQQRGYHDFPSAGDAFSPSFLPASHILKDSP